MMKALHWFFPVVGMLTVILSTSMSVRAAIIHESATFAPGGDSPAITPGQWLGSRFSVDGVVNVASVGGHFSGHHLFGSIFTAIVSLSSPSALPSENPFDDSLLATTLFSPPAVDGDLFVPLSVTLNPGHYALIFGSGQFGADGHGAMRSGNIDIPGAASYIIWSISGQPPMGDWYDMAGGSGGLRFLVKSIPEPGTGFLAAAAIFALRRRRAGA